MATAVLSRPSFDSIDAGTMGQVAEAASSQTLSGHVPHTLIAKATDLGRVSKTEMMHLAIPKVRKLRGAKIMKKARDTPPPKWREKKVTRAMLQLASSAPSAVLKTLLHSRIMPSPR